ncbi:hypothetical protein SynA1524_00132 [Synechococcus sp. A15-24]|nr:hypothetical protein SynA1524_00132 [Synechococcus sp. A15-24]
MSGNSKAVADEIFALLTCLDNRVCCPPLVSSLDWPSVD